MTCFITTAAPINSINGKDHALLEIIKAVQLTYLTGS